jgi:large conductance mechanosensitive channel
MIKGFRDFLMRGNVVDLAVAVVIGAAFGAMVTQFTKSFLEPLIQLLTGGHEVGGKFTVNAVAFDYGAFLNSVIGFVLIAAVVYFLIVVPMTRVAKRLAPAEEKASGPSEVELLAEIRDALRETDRTPASVR